MQTIYTKDNINLNYLNNYVKYNLTSNVLNLYNTLYNKEVNINGDNNILKELIIKLQKGINNDELYIILSKLTDKPDILFEYLLQNFIIE